MPGSDDGHDEVVTPPTPETTRPPAPDANGRAGPEARAAAAVPPPALLLVSNVSLQLGAAIAVQLFDTLGPFGTTFLRIALSAVLLLVARRKQIDGRARDHIGLLVLFGCVIGGTNLAFYGAIDRIPLGIAVAVEFVGPLGVAALTSRRLKEFFWVGLAAVGLLMLTPEIGRDLDPVGIVLALVAGAGWAGFILISPRVAKDVGDSGLALAMVAASVFTLPFALTGGGLERLDLGLLAAALAVAILSTTLPLSLEFEALKRMTARAYGVMVTLEPVVAVVVGAIVLSQALGPTALIAVAFITVAAIGVNLTDRHAPEATPIPPA